MKKIITLIVLLAISLGLSAQTSGGPDAYGYTWKNSFHTVSPPVYSWFDITAIGIEVNGLGDDNILGPITASNGFQFYWYPTPQFYIGSNGYISFSGVQMASQFPVSVPLSDGKNNWIAPFMADLTFDGVGNPGKVYYWYNSDSLVVSYVDVPHWTSTAPTYTGSNTFQVILNKVDKSITFNYKTMSIGTYSPLDAVAGIENVTGTVGLGALIDVLPTNYSTIKFYYPGTVTYAVTDLGINWAGNDKSAGIFVKKGGTTPLLANAKNFGNQVLGGFTVRDTVVTQTNSPVTQGSISLPGLGVGLDTTVTLPNTFTPSAAGTFKLNTSVSGITGDMVPTNDRMQQEIISIDTTLAFMVLDYSDGLPDGTGISWSGGNGGIGVYIEPPMYPIRIVSSRFYVTANATPPVGFAAVIYDDNGPNGGPGAMLDSVFVPGTNVVTGGYTVVPTSSNNIILGSGGFYLLWYMGGATIALGRDITEPISRRTYEVLGHSWSGYRDMFAEDFLMGVTTEIAGPKASFSFDNSQDPLISFTDNSTQGPTSWSWDFDDNGATSNLQNPTHTFSSTGSHNVCLTVSNTLGSNTFCQPVVIANGPPVTNFTYILAGMPTIAFIDLTAGGPNSWSWDFDDGANDTSSTQNPVYTFKSNGTHNVCLTASNAFGTGQQFCAVLNVTGVGLDELSPTGFSLQPNPMTDGATVILPAGTDPETVVLRLYNIAGKLMDADSQVLSGSLYLKRGKLPAGVYILEISNADGSLGCRKLIAQ